MEQEMSKGFVAKKFNNSYLYNKTNNEPILFNFIMKAEEVDREDPSFADIRYEVKRRQVSNSLIKVLDSKNVVLKLADIPLPKAFKVFVANDVREQKKTNNLKVFIDCGDIIKHKEGVYKCTNPDILIAYLVNAGNSLIYYADPKRIVMRSEIIQSGARCFALLFTHIVDYLYKISNMSGVKDQCMYLSAMYYIVNILGKEINQSSRTLCRTISGLSEREEELILLYFDNDEKSFKNLPNFMETLAQVLKLPKLTLDTFMEKWLFLYGSGTHYALELYPAFAALLTNTYVGCYINNQKTIEKITGRHMADFSTAVLKIIRETV